MGEESSLIDSNFPLFSQKSKQHSKTPHPKHKPTPQLTATATVTDNDPTQDIETQTQPLEPNSTFSDLGLSEFLIHTCTELKIHTPTPVQQCCIPKILAGSDVLGISQTGSGKTAAFALPIIHQLALNPYGVFALVITPTRELAFQLAEQFRALGSSLHLRCAVVIGGMNSIHQAKSLLQRPHVVVSTPGRLKVLLQDNPDLPPLFSRTKFLVLDEADRVLDVEFEDELRVIFKCLPKTRQTLLFSATMTDGLRTLHSFSRKKPFFYKQYAGLVTPESLRHQYLCVAEHVKVVYLLYILSKMEEMSARSAIVFANEASTCHKLALLLEELDQGVAEVHGLMPQSSRLAGLQRFKAGQVPLLISTAVVERGLDIPTVDLVINYDLPRDPTKYVHRAGRTARAGRMGLVMSIVSESDLELLHAIEAELGKKIEELECKEKEAIADITKVFKARRVANMKYSDEGFEEKVKARKKQKLKTLADKGLLKKKTHKRKRAVDA